MKPTIYAIPKFCCFACLVLVAAVAHSSSSLKASDLRPCPSDREKARRAIYISKTDDGSSAIPLARNLVSQHESVSNKLVLAEVLINCRDRDAARKEIDEVLLEQPENLQAMLLRAQVEKSSGNARKAIEILIDRASQANEWREFEKCVQAVFDIALEVSGPEGALCVISPLAKDEDKTGVFAHCSGLANFHLGRLDASLIDADRAIEIGGCNRFAYTLKARVLTAQGKHQDALASYRVWQSTEPDNARANREFAAYA